MTPSRSASADAGEPDESDLAYWRRMALTARQERDDLADQLLEAERASTTRLARVIAGLKVKNKHEAQCWNEAVGGSNCGIHVVHAALDAVLAAMREPEPEEGR